MAEIYQAQVKLCMGAYSAPMTFDRLLKKYRGDYRKLMKAIAGQQVICLDGFGDKIQVRDALRYIYSKQDRIEQIAYESGNTLEHYQNFLKNHSKGKLVDEAKKKIIELEFQACAHCDQFVNFIEKYGVEVEDIQKVKKKAASVCIQEINSIESCESFRKRFPDSDLYYQVVDMEKKMIKDVLNERVANGEMETIANLIYDQTSDRELKSGLTNWKNRNIRNKMSYAKKEISFEVYDIESNRLLSDLQIWLDQFNPPIKEVSSNTST